MSRIFSGVQPTNNLHIGNYLGAIKNWIQLQNEYDSIFCIVDLHALTNPQATQKMQEKILDLATTYLAASLDPKKCTLFIQSHVTGGTFVRPVRAARFPSRTSWGDHLHLCPEESRLDSPGPCPKHFTSLLRFGLVWPVLVTSSVR